MAVFFFFFFFLASSAPPPGHASGTLCLVLAAVDPSPPGTCALGSSSDLALSGSQAPLVFCPSQWSLVPTHGFFVQSVGVWTSFTDSAALGVLMPFLVISVMYLCGPSLDHGFLSRPAPTSVLKTQPLVLALPPRCCRCWWMFCSSDVADSPLTLIPLLGGGVSHSVAGLPRSCAWASTECLFVGFALLGGP